MYLIKLKNRIRLWQYAFITVQSFKIDRFLKLQLKSKLVWKDCQGQGPVHSLRSLQTSFTERKYWPYNDFDISVKENSYLLDTINFFKLKKNVLSCCFCYFNNHAFYFQYWVTSNLGSILFKNQPIKYSQQNRTFTVLVWSHPWWTQAYLWVLKILNK